MQADPNNRMRALLDEGSAARLIDRLLNDDKREDQGEAAFPRVPGYRIDRRIGGGGGGEVFLGRPADSDRVVAIKVLHTAASDNANMRRAWRELDLLSDTKLPCVPEVLDYDVADSRLFIVTSHVDGDAVDKHVKNLRLGVRETVELLVRIGEAVQQIHERGVIHRDLKPDNILIRANGTPAIIDFGVAALINAQGMDTLTQQGTPVGTVAFMAPEQARGERSQQSTRTDVYGLGAVACLLLTHHTPHPPSESVHEAVRRAAQEPARSPRSLNPDLPRDLALIIEHALAFEPSHRYATAADLVADLRRWLEHEPIVWQKPGWLTRQRLAYRRNPRRFVQAAAVWVMAAVTFAAGAIALSQWRVANEQAANAREAERLRGVSDDLARQAAAAGALWEQEARKRQEWAEKVKAAEIARIAILERQRRFVIRALEEGELFNATLALHTIAEQIRAFDADDAEALGIFIDQLNRLIDAAEAPAPVRPDSTRSP